MNSNTSNKIVNGGATKHVDPTCIDGTGYTDRNELIGSSNYLRVDGVYGNDDDAAKHPLVLSFKTIGAALACALIGQEVFVYPGVYKESITVPTGVCLSFLA